MEPTAGFHWIPEEHCIFISLGSNIHPEENIPRAVNAIKKYGQVIRASTVWETAPVGTVGPKFLNAAILLQVYVPSLLLKTLILRRIEANMGRKRTFNKNAPRTIDLDILIADGQVIDPAVWTLAYLAVPLAEILPDLMNPELGKSLAQIASELLQPDEIHPRSDVVII